MPGVPSTRCALSSRAEVPIISNERHAPVEDHGWIDRRIELESRLILLEPPFAQERAHDPARTKPDREVYERESPELEFGCVVDIEAERGPLAGRATHREVVQSRAPFEDDPPLAGRSEQEA